VEFNGCCVHVERAQANGVYQPVIDFQAEVDEQRGEVYQEANALADRMWRDGEVQGGRLLEYHCPPRYTPRLMEVEVNNQVTLTEEEDNLFHNILWGYLVFCFLVLFPHL